MVDLSKRHFFFQDKSEGALLDLPWLARPASFTDICTRCSKCLNACETQIIVLGDGGFPKVDFSRGECTFCHQCVDVCSEPLFRSTAEQAWAEKAVVNPTCLAKQNIECRSCSDSCESMAITFKTTLGKVAQPTLNAAACNTCGACVSVCPASSIEVKSF
ncbi:ferredoxin-type protein NapF [Vibrio sp.]|uniref:ferredoxin-type protein NapF n=1 Tax=Vibrio sp. TaxID=678 RepID=UPI00311D941F